jgi:hypothetical protein
MSFLLLLMSSLQQNWRKGQNRFCLEVRGVGGEGRGWEGAGGRGQGAGGEMAQTMYAHMNKFKKNLMCGVSTNLLFSTKKRNEVWQTL